MCNACYRKISELKKSQERELKKLIASVRGMWQQVREAEEKTRQHVSERRVLASFVNSYSCAKGVFLQAEIIHSVVYGSDKLTVDGSRIQPNVPSMLLNECQEEIYEVCVLVFSLHDFQGVCSGVLPASRFTVAARILLVCVAQSQLSFLVSSQ